MKVNRSLVLCLLPLFAVALLSSCAATSSRTPATIDAASEATLKAMSAKLAAAKTIGVQTQRRTAPELTTGTERIDNAQIHLLVQRPNRARAVVRGSGTTRTLWFDQGKLTLLDSKHKAHGSLATPADLDKALEAVYNRYDIDFPLASLLASDAYNTLLSGGGTIEKTREAKAGGVACDVVKGTREGMTWELAVAKPDSLPRRLTIFYPGVKGPALDFNITSWNLNARAANADFTPAIPKDSWELEFIPVE